jgi:hypothetical protein
MDIDKHRGRLMGCIYPTGGRKKMDWSVTASEEVDFLLLALGVGFWVFWTVWFCIAVALVWAWEPWPDRSE